MNNIRINIGLQSYPVIKHHLVTHLVGKLYFTILEIKKSKHFLKVVGSLLLEVSGRWIF